MHVASVELAARVGGRTLKDLTGWEGWLFEPEEISALREVWSQVDIPMTPMTAAVSATVGIVALKAALYVAWRRNHAGADAPPLGRQAVAEAGGKPAPEPLDLPSGPATPPTPAAA